MNTKKIKKSIICILILIAFCKIGFTQSMGKFNFAAKTLKPTNSAQNTFLDLNNLENWYGSQNGVKNFYAKKGGYFIKLFLDEAYYGKDDQSALFNLNVSFNVVLSQNGGSNITLPTCTLNITNINPVEMQYVDLIKYVSNDINGFSNTSTGFSINKITLQNIVLTDMRISPLQSFSGATNNIRICITEDFEFGINVSNKNVTIMPVVNNMDKSVLFKWSTTSQPENEMKLPNYEFQLLKLYNTSMERPYNSDETKIYAKIDWSQAMKLELESNSIGLVLTMGEGNGYYAWRIRPIGTMEGGFANDKNYGIWSECLTDGIYQGINGNIDSKGVFYYNDKDKNINYIYSKVITEGNKISENITYATVLNQVKQKQVYNQSDNKTIVQQIILDRNGRPSIQTLPAPYRGENRLAGYIEDLVVDSEGKVYSSKNFDLNGNYLKPDKMYGDITNYYSDINYLQPDITVPNAQEYPFSRTIYADDNTGNVVEVSGVGITHMVGNQNENMGRTTKTTFETASKIELVRLFGDEAPYPNTVQKITTTDPNNISTTSYVNMEGKTIATSIIYNDKINPFDDNTSNPVQIVADISNNTKIGESFISSKKFNFFQATNLSDFSYKIDKIDIEQLCAKITLSCSYILEVTISKLDGSEKIYAIPKKISSLPDFVKQTSLQKGYILIQYDPEKDFIDANNNIVNLKNKLFSGEYIIEKKLTPNPDIDNSVSISNPSNGVNLPLERISEWVKTSLDKIFCDQELFNFYNDYYKIAYYMNHYVPSTNGGTPGGFTNFTPDDRTTLWYNIIFTAEFDTKYKLFKDGEHPNPYTVIIKSKTGADITPSTYPPTQTAPELIPDHTILKSRCCELVVNLFYTPDYKCPSPTDLKLIRAYIDDPANTNPNIHKLFIPDENYIDHMNDIGGKYLSEADFPDPLAREYLKKIPDFEGYAISMINAARSATDETAINILYAGISSGGSIASDPLMQGWNKLLAPAIYEGTFNKMVFKMLTDYYYPDMIGTTEQIVPDPLIIPGQYTPPIPILTDPCSGNQSEDKLPNTNYKCAEIAQCWKSIVKQIIIEYCGEKSTFPTGNPDEANVSKGVDNNNPGDGGKTHDDHFDKDKENNIIKRFVKWLGNKTLSWKMRKQVSDPNETILSNAIVQGKHAVLQFLECTGYQFADVLTYNYGTTNNIPQVISDNALYRYSNFPYSTHYPYGKYNDLNQIERFVYLKNDFSNNNYTSPDFIQYNRDETFADKTFIVGTLGKMFPNIYDPVYAFKYYEWESAILGTCSPCLLVNCDYNTMLKDFEYSICFNDPNWCVDNNGNRIPCCGWDEMVIGKYKPCNFCDKGFYTCKYDHFNWANGQRYTFYEKIKATDFNNLMPPTLSATCDLDCDKKNTATNWYSPPDGYYGSMDYIPYQRSGFFASFWLCEAKTEFPTTPAIFQNLSYSQVQALISTNDCIDKCEARRNEFRDEVIKMFTDRCYIIGVCMNGEENVVPWEDVEEVVNKMVVQCKSQCPITTWRCNDTDCRTWGESNIAYIHPTFTNGNTPGQSYTILEFGVGGPNCNCLSGLPQGNNCSNQNIEYNFTYYEYTLNKQARQWLPVLDIRSLCDQNGSFTGISNGGYMWKYNQITKKWSWQPHIFTGCTPAPIYKTFVEKNTYELPNDPPNGIPSDEKIETPKVPIGFTKP